MTRLKILHINTLDSVGGASQVALDLLQYLEEDCTMVVKKKNSKNPNIIKLKKKLFDRMVWLIDMIFWKLGKLESSRAFFSLDNTANNTYSKLRKLKEYKEAEVIHLHNLHGGYFDFSALEKIAREKKIVWTLHDMWAITGGEAYTFENENYKKGIGYTPYISLYPLLNPLMDKRQHFLEKKKIIYKKIHDSLTIVPVSEWLTNCFEESYVYDSSLCIHRIQNGIDTSVFKNKQGRTWKKPRILFFNFNNPFKGSRIFIDIISRIEKDFDLCIVGEKLESDMEYTHLRYINDRQLLSEIYNQSDILIFPSLAENFPLTVLEAMACGVCVIGSDTGGIPEMLDNSCGYLFRSNDSEDLLEKINTALRDPEAVRRKGLVAEKRVLENYTLEKNCKAYSELYRDVFKFSNWDLSEDATEEKGKPKISEFFD